MPNDEMKDDLRAQWQNQPPEGGRMSVEEVRVQAQQFDKRIRNRNIREYTVMVLSIPYAVFIAWRLRAFPLMVLSMGLCIAATVVIAYQFRKRMSRRSFPADAASLSCLEFYRRELERQRDANLSVWSWYIGPMIPGAATMVLGMASIPTLGSFVALFIAVAFTAAFILTGVANKRGARRLQQKIDELRG